jgi:YgiT-type zinc finger domain-containing protein
MEERRIKQHFWSKRGLIVIEDFPAGVCRRCGEKVVKADVGRLVAELVEGSRRLRKARTMSVPVIKFVTNAA